MAKNASYLVGHRRPPVHTRFQKGRSGNPGGRPGPRRLVERLLQIELESLMRMSPDDVVALEVSSVFEAIAKELALRAARTELAAIRLVFSFMPERGMKRPRRARFPTGMLPALMRGCPAGPVAPEPPTPPPAAPSEGVSPTLPAGGDTPTATRTSPARTAQIVPEGSAQQSQGASRSLREGCDTPTATRSSPARTAQIVPEGSAHPSAQQSQGVSADLARPVEPDGAHIPETARGPP